MDTLLKEQLDTVAHDVFEHKQALPAITDTLREVKGSMNELKTLMHTTKAAPARPAMDTQASQSRKETKAFTHYMRKGDASMLEGKSFSGSVDGEGGYTVPPEISDRIYGTLGEQSFFRRIARVTNISTDALEVLLSNRNMQVGWAQEKDAHNTTDTPEIRKLKIAVHELYARPRATQRLLDDSAVHLEAWIAQQVAEQMAASETEAFIQGDGNNKPRGFLTEETSEAEESNKIQVIKTGAAGAFGAENPQNALLDLFHALKPAYLSRAVWIMSRSAQAEVRKIRDPNTLHHLWQPQLSATQLPSLLGHPVYITDHMPSLVKETESTSIAFGNFFEGYHIVDRKGVHVLRDPFSSKPYVEFYTSKRVGGQVTNHEAIKLLKFAA
jgi:HK97 family phage major capsid protein